MGIVIGEGSLTTKFDLYSDVKTLSITTLKNSYDNIFTDYQAALQVFIDTEIKKLERELTKEELKEFTIKLGEQFKKGDGKEYNLRLEEILGEIERREKLAEEAKKNTEASVVKLTGDSIYNAGRYTEQEKDLTTVIGNLKDYEDKVVQLNADLSKIDKVKDPDGYAKALNEITLTEKLIVQTKAESKALEDGMAKVRGKIDAHQTVIGSLGTITAEDDLILDEYIKAYATAVDGQKLDFTGDASDVRAITFGSLSTDAQILNAIRDAAIAGKTEMVFEADLWSWNQKTLKMLSDKGFLLDLSPSTDAYDKKGNKIGTQGVSRGGNVFPVFNSDLKVSWAVEQPK
jgi:uncharacterized protein (DUF885 family)